MGPLADMRRLNLQAFDSQLRNQVASVLAAERRFITTSIADLTKLSTQYAELSGPNSLARYSLQLPGFQALLKSIKSPWLDEANKMGSMNGLAGLYGIGSALKLSPPFDLKLTEKLRLDLGDWRAEIAWPTDMATNLFARTSLYEQQGLNPDLAEFPYPAFHEITGEAGLRVPDVSAAVGYDLQWSESDETEQDDDFDRTNRAYGLLHRFESQLRKFIQERMEAKFGTNWIKQRVPGKMREKWLDKQRRDTGNLNWPAIAYADFTDYVTIITRNDNWRELFEPTFVNKDSVQESFRRLHPMRVTTMHARLITEDDELYMHVEMKRILTAIGVWLGP